MSNWKIIIVAAGCLFLLRHAPAQPGQEGVVGKVILQKLMQQGKYAQVAEATAAAIAGGVVRDSLPGYLLIAGQASLELDSLDRAKAHFQRLLDLLKTRQTPDPFLQAGALSGLGDFFLRKGNFSAALEYHRQSVRLREEAFGKLSEITAAGYNELGYTYLAAGDKETAYKLLILSLDIRQALLPEDHPDLAGSFLNLGACMLDREKFEEAVWYYSKALELRSALLGEGHPKTAQAHQALALAYFKVGEGPQALKGFQDALEIWIQQLGPEHPALAQVYEQIGDVHFGLYASREAERHFERAAMRCPGTDKMTHALLSVKIGRCMQARGEERPALGRYLAALEVLDSVPGSPAVAPLLMAIGDAYLKQGAFIQALPILQKAVRRFQLLSARANAELVQCLNMEAMCYLLMERPESALSTLKRAESLLERSGGVTASGRAMLLKTKARANFALGRYDMALNMARNALGLLWPDRNVERVNRVIAPEIVNLLVLEAKLMPYTGSRYADAAALLETALQLARRLALNYSEEARWEWAPVHFTLYAGAVEANFQAWKFSGSGAFLARALQISELYKQQRLEDAVFLARAPRFRGIPVRLLSKQRALETSLFQLEKQRWSAAAKERGILESRLAQEIAGLSAALESLRKELLLESSDYARFFDSGKTPGMETIRSLLEPDQALLEYFVAENQIYLFVVSQDTFQGYRIPQNPAFERMVMDFLVMNSKFRAIKAKYPMRFAEDWARLAFRLYEQLIAPATEQTGLPSRLVIVPDGVLHYLPFEALLTKAPENPGSFEGHAYLINTYSTGYAYSAKSLQASKAWASRGRFWGKYLLTMAPVFRPDTPGFSPVGYNADESGGLKKLFGGRMLQGSEASLNNFLDLAPQFRVLHLATHGKSAASGRESAFIAFAPPRDKNADGNLYAGDLYGLRLRTDLVVLSGFEVNIGEYHSGESLLGLGYGLLYAGAKSSMATMWNPNHRESSRLVVRCFYYLRKGLPKDVALQLAKKDFIAQNPDYRAHPFYWAGLKLNGDSASLPDPRLKWLLAWLIAISGLGLAVFLYLKWVRPKKL
ncbi:MAG: CHAT domain-containing protein [Saprospiraceae bacterium]|jgi:CHAT domain-containing protein